MAERPSVVMNLSCAVHRHREWVPIEVHHVYPLGMGGPNSPSNRITVCANGHYSIHAFMDLLMKNAGSVPWLARRHFGRRVQEFAVSGWTQAGKPTVGHS